MLGQGGDTSSFGGGSPPGINPLMAMSLQGLENVASGEMDVFSGDVGAAARQALQEILGQSAQNTDELFNQTVAGPAQEDLERTLAELNINAVGSGNLFGSERSEQARLTGEDFLDALTRERTRFAFDSETRNRQDKLAALGLAPSIAGLDTEIGSSLLAAGDSQRLAELQQFGADVALFEADRQRELDLLQMLLGGSIAPTFGVSGGFALPSTGSSSGGVIGGFVEGLFT